LGTTGPGLLSAFTMAKWQLSP